ncbi:hypothetical protein BKA81DRAFT_136570 [Phyllosticta paracitricarpa]
MSYIIGCINVLALSMIPVQSSAMHPKQHERGMQPARASVDCVVDPQVDIHMRTSITHSRLPCFFASVSRHACVDAAAVAGVGLFRRREGIMIKKECASHRRPLKKASLDKRRANDVSAHKEPGFESTAAGR